MAAKVQARHAQNVRHKMQRTPDMPACTWLRYSSYEWCGGELSQTHTKTCMRLCTWSTCPPPPSSLPPQ